ncbi:site-specific integrase [Burkholderia cenocepacia]|uniref:site-specific integrase n=1 Tax=Burkholderia cenocepacia TaxID=95486 RepID=UPI002AB67FB4|nr:site-specific integrase [Burkholderia cenocepacia]
MKFVKTDDHISYAQKSQLQIYTRKEFKLFSHFLGGKIELTDAENLPLVRWPNGRWCVEANLYLSECFKKGFSSRGSQGGTLGTICYYLAPLIRHVNLNMDGFAALTDAQFAFAVRQLRAKVTRHGKVVSKNSSTSTFKIASAWLDFLCFIGEFYARPNFISQDGTIKAYRVRKESIAPNGRVVVTYPWYHWSFPTEEDLEQPRHPINDHTLSALRLAADDSRGESAMSTYIHSRTLVMFAILDEVGMRRMELTLKLTRRTIRNAIDAWSVARKANRQEVPMLNFGTVKHKKHAHREVPVSPMLLDFLDDYLVTSRLYLKSLGIRVTPDMALLFNAKNGEELRPNTITQEFWRLAKRADIKVPASPHLMRHRYITNALVRLIVAHNLPTKADFGKLILDDTDFKRKVQQVTGHSSIAGLETYLKLAYDIVGKIDWTIARERILSALEAHHRAVVDYESCIDRGVDSSKELRRLAQASMEIAKMYRRSDLYSPFNA